MIAPLNVFQLNSNDVGVWVFTVDSLLEALKVIQQRGSGEYLIYPQKSGRRRFHEVAENGNIVLQELEEVVTARR